MGCYVNSVRLRTQSWEGDLFDEERCGNLADSRSVVGTEAEPRNESPSGGMADALGSGPSEVTLVEVRLLSWALKRKKGSRFAVSPLFFVWVFWLAALTPPYDSRAWGNERLRVIVETDAGGDPDDEQSLVRFLLYTNEWDVAGIIATREQARDGENLNAERTGMGIIRRQLKAYGECHSHLVQHDPRYPTEEQLQRRTVAGYGGDAGIRLIIDAVEAQDPRPVWFLNWGTDHGSEGSSLKRALDKVLSERGQEGYAKFKQKLRLSSADKFEEHTTKISPPFPLWVDTFRPELERRRWYHRFSGITATAGGFDVKRDLLTGHGPLGALYPLNTTHPQKEGDTMTFLYLVPTGMNDPNKPGWGSWAGRYGRQEAFPKANYYWANQVDTWCGTTHRDNTLKRFAADLQNDFRARLEWCVKPRAEGNHPPVVRIAGEQRQSAKSGEILTLDASRTSDPDGQILKYEWWIYLEAGTYRGEVMLEGADTPIVRVKAPQVKECGTIHVLLTIRDSGQPALTRYGRVVVTVEP